VLKISPSLCHTHIFTNCPHTSAQLGHENQPDEVSFGFNVHGFVHRKNILIYIYNKMQRYTVYFIWKLLYMFWLVPSPVIRRANNCIYSIWYLSGRYCYLCCRQMPSTALCICQTVTATCAVAKCQTQHFVFVRPLLLPMLSPNAKHSTLYLSGRYCYLCCHQMPSTALCICQAVTATCAVAKCQAQHFVKHHYCENDNKKSLTFGK
jgi:hypothetical protein